MNTLKGEAPKMKKTLKLKSNDQAFVPAVPKQSEEKENKQDKEEKVEKKL